jgi:hypothetical protein
MTLTSRLSLVAAAALIAVPALAAEQIKVVERPTKETTLNLTTKGVDAVGDLLSFANPLFDAANKTQVGTDQGFCVRTVVGKSWECNFTLLLKGGQVTVEGPFVDTGDSTFTVTGGTGKYAGAKGSLLLHTRAGKPESYDFTLDLL